MGLVWYKYRDTLLEIKSYNYFGTLMDKNVWFLVVEDI